MQADQALSAARLADLERLPQHCSQAAPRQQNAHLPEASCRFGLHRDWLGGPAMKKALTLTLSLLVLMSTLAGTAWSGIPFHPRVPIDPQAGPKVKAHTIHHHKDPYAPDKPVSKHKAPKPPIKKGLLH